MPLCEGRSTGPGQDIPCPDRCSGNNVVFGQGDLWLCKACLDFRFPTLTVATKDIHTIDIAAEVSTGTTNPLQNELLCFLQKRCSVVAFDDLVTICANFYTAKEIECARVTLATFASDKRIPRYKGCDRDKNKKCVSDLLKLCLDPTCQLPCFYAMEITRLPPVGVDHIDVSALLQEITSLRQEIRSIALVRSDLDAMSSNLTDLRREMDSFNTSLLSLHQEVQGISQVGNSLPDLRAEVDELRGSVIELRREVQIVKSAQSETVQSTPLGPVVDCQPNTNCISADLHFPPLSTKRSVDYAACARMVPDRTTTERSVQSHPPDRSRQNSRVKPVVGRNNHLSALKPATARQSNIHVFVSRLSTETKAEVVEESVRAALLSASGGSIDSPSIQCEPLRTKHDSYLSFHVSVAVDSATKDGTIAILNSADNWPAGVLVRRYYVNRNG